MTDKTRTDEDPRKRRAAELRKEIANVGEGKTPVPSRPLSPREITDRAAAEEAAKERKPRRR